MSALATSQRTEIALLETTDGLARRWLVVPSSGQLTEVRSAVNPGAVVTAFPEPPAATKTASYAPPPADQYHGFLEDSASGALYPSPSPGALTAVIPPAA